MRRAGSGNVCAVIIGRGRRARHVVLGATAVALTACSGAGPQASAANTVAGSFVAAVGRHDGPAACALLSPSAEQSLTSDGTACEKAVLEVTTSGRPTRTQVWGDEAQVVTQGDVIFLMHLSGGWRIRAAGCTPQPDRPFSCQVAA